MRGIRDVRMRVPATVVTALSLVGAVLAVPNAAAQDRPPTDPGELRVEAGVAPGAGVPDPRPGEAFADPKIAELQQTATGVQQELSALASRIRTAKGKLDAATAKLSEARAEREAAAALLAEQQAEIDAFSKSVYTGLGRPNRLRVLLTATNPSDMLQGTSMVDHLRSQQDDQLTGALKRHRAAVASERAALGVEEQAAKSEEDLVRRNGDATNRADAISSELRGPIDIANAAVIAQQEAQKKRNAKTAKNWKAYKAGLDAAGIVPPHAGSLRDPARLPGGLKPVLGKDGKPQAGIAQTTVDGKRLLVLPKETIAAVSGAIGALGKPYVPREHGAGPSAYSCDGLVHTVFKRADLAMPSKAGEQFAVGKRVRLVDARPGDLVFVGPAKYGVQHVGIVLDGRTMLASDGRLAGVVVTELPAEESVLAVTRPALGQGDKRALPRRAQGELTWRCGGVELPRSVSAGPGGLDGAAGAWGGYPNGLIPPSALCSIGIGGHALRCDAAQAFLLMSHGFAQRFGNGLCVTDSYRTFNQQVDLYRRKPALAAVPGTSNHGWALALDMCGRVESFGTAQYGWLAANAGNYGWINPYWARPGGGREEAWHWEYVGR